MKPIVDQEVCTGCELCVDTCPDVFEMSEDGLAVARLSIVPPEMEELCMEAIDCCPVKAISLE